MYIKKEYMDVITEVAEYLKIGELPDVRVTKRFLEVEDELASANRAHIERTRVTMNEKRAENPRYGRPKNTKYVKPRCPVCGKMLIKSRFKGYDWDCRDCSTAFLEEEVKYI